MHADDLRILFDYSYAGNARILDAAARLDPAEFSGYSPLRGAESVQRILVHMLDTEQGWRGALRSGGHSSAPELDPADYPDIPTLAAAWGADEEHMRAWLATLDDAAVNAPAFNGRPLWQYLVHVVN